MYNALFPITYRKKQTAGSLFAPLNALSKGLAHWFFSPHQILVLQVLSCLLLSPFHAAHTCSLFTPCPQPVVLDMTCVFAGKPYCLAVIWRNYVFFNTDSEWMIYTHLLAAVKFLSNPQMNSITGTGWPGRFWGLLLWRYSRRTWTGSCAACSGWPCFGGGVGLGDPRRSLPTPNILWFCDSVIFPFLVQG